MRRSEKAESSFATSTARSENILTAHGLGSAVARAFALRCLAFRDELSRQSLPQETGAPANRSLVLTTMVDWDGLEGHMT
jgi:hypothetical protein